MLKADEKSLDISQEKNKQNISSSIEILYLRLDVFNFYFYLWFSRMNNNSVIIKSSLFFLFTSKSSWQENRWNSQKTLLSMTFHFCFSLIFLLFYLIACQEIWRFMKEIAKIMSSSKIYFGVFRRSLRSLNFPKKKNSLLYFANSETKNIKNSWEIMKSNGFQSWSFSKKRQDSWAANNKPSHLSDLKRLILEKFVVSSWFLEGRNHISQDFHGDFCQLNWVVIQKENKEGSIFFENEANGMASFL